MRRLIASFASGWLAAQVFLAGLLVLDVSGLGGLVGAAADPLLPIVMLSLGLGALIGVAVSATALTSEPPHGGRRVHDGPRSGPFLRLRERGQASARQNRAA